MQRNSSGFVSATYAVFALFVSLTLIGLWTLEEPLMVKGYYLMASVGLIYSSIALAKVQRDKYEDQLAERRRRGDDE